MTSDGRDAGASGTTGPASPQAASAAARAPDDAERGEAAGHQGDRGRLRDGARGHDLVRADVAVPVDEAAPRLTYVDREGVLARVEEELELAERGVRPRGVA